MKHLEWDEQYVKEREQAFKTISDKSYFFDWEFADIFECAKHHGDRELCHATFREVKARNETSNFLIAIATAQGNRIKYECED
jgi:hypothetical protein